MDETQVQGRTPLLGQVLTIWRGCGGSPTWTDLTAALGGLAESLCLVRWRDEFQAVIEVAGAQAVLVYGMPLAGRPANALTGRRQGEDEACQARDAGGPLTVEGGVDGRRIARLYLPLLETPPAIACAVVRID